MFSKNYHLGYRGGSGGFILLHFLLLSGKYFSELENNVKKVIENQWDIIDHRKWKLNEIWPNNDLTFLNDKQHTKLLFFCNPTINDFFYYEFSFDEIKLSYNKIKDKKWPDINNLEDILGLSEFIKNELFVTDPLKFYFLTLYSTPLELKNARHNYVFDKSIWIYTDIISQNELAHYKNAYWYANNSISKMSETFIIENESSKWNDTYVDKTAINFLNYTDIQLKLQNFINEPDILIELGLIDRVTNEQLSLLKQWINLHPEFLLKKIGIKRR